MHFKRVKQDKAGLSVSVGCCLTKEITGRILAEDHLAKDSDRFLGYIRIIIPYLNRIEPVPLTIMSKVPVIKINYCFEHCMHALHSSSCVKTELVSPAI